MKTFLLAALAGLAAANDAIENQTAYSVSEDLIGGGKTLGTLATVVTGWSKNGSGSDAVIDRKLWMDYEKESTNYVNGSKSTILIAIANEDNTAFEAEKFTYTNTDTDSPRVIMDYAKFEEAMPEELKDLAFTDKKYLAIMKESGLTFSPSIVNPVDFWNLDTETSANIASNYWLGLTRSDGGIAGIQTGVSR